jgi:LmbE family N-acetylglucosaminyl deacetylase
MEGGHDDPHSPCGPSPRVRTDPPPPTGAARPSAANCTWDTAAIILSPVRYEPEAPPVVLSPHLDDAVLSVFTVLTDEPPPLVVNLFDGIPPPGPAPFSVRLCRATDAAAQMHRRRAEDADALARAGCEAVSLGVLEADSRPRGADPDLAELNRLIDEAVPTAGALHAPIGMGSHPDHLIARDLAFSLSAAAIPLWLYADLPYAITWGWPAWVSGEASDPNLDPDAAWARAIERLPVAPDALEPEVVRLDEWAQARKRDALAAYESQFSMLAGGPHRRFDGWALTCEVRWRVGPS